MYTVPAVFPHHHPNLHLHLHLSRSGFVSIKRTMSKARKVLLHDSFVLVLFVFMGLGAGVLIGFNTGVLVNCPSPKIFGLLSFPLLEAIEPNLAMMIKCARRERPQQQWLPLIKVFTCELDRFSLIHVLLLGPRFLFWHSN